MACGRDFRRTIVANAALLQEVRRSLQGRRQSDHKWMGWFQSLSTQPPKTARGRHDASDLTTRQGIFEDSADFTSHCQNHDGPAIATQLKALADDYERRAEKASLDDAKHCSIRC
jgi:hypothetical protein